MNISELKPNEYNNYYHTYIKTLGNVEMVPEMVERSNAFVAILEQLNDANFDFSYAEGKWTIKELLLHIIDTERVFQYRAFTFARNNGCVLKGFDQDVYVSNSAAAIRSKASLIEEFKSVRGSSISLFSSFQTNVFENSGVIEGNKMTVKAAGFLICGHQKHHETILKDKYLPLLKD
ncbi:DinB family protein [Galbibacter sp. BG1]|uniref:DinB family protein n=1 Tax=Galbibacter sp. BG1 TaxID=1170699 RepID=UPI0015BA7FBC|nr:DinB family protein [Galbibacter sp. BG1]QLE02817.1 DinB family protein [Galbibacter sp. BG1]